MLKERLAKYSQSKEIISTINHARDYEQSLLTGFDLGDNAKIKAWIGIETGFWEGVLEVPYGKMFFSSLDIDISKVVITSVEKRFSLDMPEFREFEIDFHDVKSIQKAKEYFKNDPILSQTYVDTYQNRSISEALVPILKSFRKQYISYTREFSFLWEKTSANSAITLFGLLKENNLLSVYY